MIIGGPFLNYFEKRQCIAMSNRDTKELLFPHASSLNIARHIAAGVIWAYAPRLIGKCARKRFTVNEEQGGRGQGQVMTTKFGPLQHLPCGKIISRESSQPFFEDG
jgi:hypothetical protein